MDDEDAVKATKRLKVNRHKLFKLYMKEVDKIAEECDWVTHFTPEMIVGIISDIINNHPEILTEI